MDKYFSIVRIALGGFWRKMRNAIGSHRGRRIGEVDELADFLSSRASMVAQTSLYGYFRTRAGTRFPELFANDEFSKRINAAKWNIWLACLSDLSVYAGGLLCSRANLEESETGRIVCAAVDSILTETGSPSGSDINFASLAGRLRARLSSCEWRLVEDNETPFVESPAALVQWAPIMDDLKQLDEEIVRNSVRFRWQEVRRELRASLDAEAIKSRAAATRSGGGPA
jgi:hypothetical protein